MIKNILGSEFKYENDKIYKLDKRNNKWSCCNDLKTSKGYISVNINKKLYALHRLIYKYHNEDWDITYSNNNVIDHININPLDNRIENLRLVNKSQNSRNKNKKENCSSKYKGIYWDKSINKWVASIRINYKKKYLGLFDNEEEAHLAYKKAYDELMNL
tara:strand:+ start:7 stop:483 length:477 start_codon:yes stop_codon:yes gene_type:complete